MVAAAGRIVYAGRTDGKPAARRFRRDTVHDPEGMTMRWNWRTGAALTLLAATIAFAGCAAPPQKPIYRDMWASVPAPAAGQGRIVFFRSAAKLGMASGDRVDVNDKPAGQLPGGGFFYLDEPAGQYTVTTSSAPDRPLTFYLMQGETKYVRMGVPFALVAGPLTPSLESDSGKVRQELSMLRYVGRGDGAGHMAAKTP
ncbi:DUF2846 domain-containing protein [Burkholderia glumae]|nr:DUF2846 domain-containing protein [Burkholderia glumae AU6208]PNL00980.1 DUF2846 domain-containing protein [Burkholderia glumae]QGA39287.1 DUF2846 domain-containing protein [Burkholderia glumae]QHP92471.1 DUF2846 domain-containing protein [Burkholderia glumae]RQZ74485.1 DUF2846 domain-containing protein [Burkholderia glumae]